MHSKVDNHLGMSAHTTSFPLVDRWVAFIMHAYIPLLLLAIVLGVMSFDIAKGLKLNANITSLMPDGVPSVDNLQKVIKKTGGYSNAMVLVESPDPEATMRFLDDLREEVLKADWASSAEYEEDTAIFERNRLIYVEQDDLREIDRRLADRIDYEKKNLRFSVDETPVEIKIRGAAEEQPPLEFDDIQEKYAGSQAESEKTKVFRNEAGDLTILVVFPKGGTTNVNYARKIIRDLEGLVEKLDVKNYHPDMSVLLGGRVTNRVASFDSIISDVTGSGLWSVSAIFLVIVFFYRRLMAIFYIGLPLAVGFLLTFALTQMTLGSLNMMTVFLVLILFGLGIDFGIHNLARYDEVRRNGGDIKRALRTIYSKTGYASLLAGITTIAGFYSLMLTNFKAFYEFGFIAGSGIALSLVSMYLFFPALMVFAEKIKVYRLSRVSHAHSETKQRAFPGALVIMIVGTILTVIATVVAPNIKFEDNFGNLKTKMPEISKINDKIKQVFPLNTDQAVIFVENLEDVSPLVDELERIKSSRTEEDATISKIRSIYSVVPRTEDQYERLEAIESIQARLLEAKRLLEDFSDKDDPRIGDIEEALTHFGVSMLTPKELPVAVQRAFTGIPGSGGYLVYVYNKKGMSQLVNAQAFVDDIRKVEANDKVFFPATEAMIFVDMLNLMRSDAGRAVIVVLATVFIVLVIAFRNFKHTLTVMVPVVVGMVWMLGLMVVLGIKLNIFNMVVLPTVLGIGIDNGIHIFHRYREEGGRVLHVVRTTGGAAFLTTLTTMLGFAGTLAASNQGLQSLGLVACLGLGCCMVSSLTVFPALLQLAENRNKKQTAGA
ncbi:MAG: MMPL family transporter [Arenicellales bacterium]|nr:MMPL family transporter [Arenicellales bacterium]